MALKGDLLAADLGNLLQMTAMNRRRGVLTVQDRGNPAQRRRLYVEGAAIRVADSASAPSPALLVVLGRLTYEGFAAAKRHAGGFGGDALQYLRAKGDLDDASETVWRRATATEDVLEVFLWRDVRFELDENAPTPESDGRPELHLDELVMEAARRHDERRRIEDAFGDLRPILRPTGAAPPDDLAPAARIAFDEVDGSRGVREIGLAAGLPRFHVESACADLLAAGCVEAVPPEELCELGDRLYAEKRAGDALRVWRTALRTYRTDVELHKRMANVLVETGRPGKACAHWRFVAGSLARDGRRREALDQYHLAWRLLPSRFRTLETIVELLSQDPGPRTRDDRAALSDAKKLLQTLGDVEDFGRALALAERLRAVDPADRDVVAAAARLNSKLGRREAAAAAWLVLADRLAEDGDLRRALETVRTVAAFDPANAKLYELRVSDLSRRLADAVRARGRSRAKAAGFVVLAAAACGYAVYAWRGERAMLRLDALDATHAASADEAAREADEVARWFALAPAGRRAAAKAAQLAQVSADLREDKRRREEAAAEERRERKAEYDRRLDEARRLVKGGRYVEALPGFRAAVAAASIGAGDAAAERELGEVERYLAEARALLVEADALAARDPDAAFLKRVALCRDYAASPEAASVRLEVVVDSAPPGAWLSVNDGAAEGRAPLVVPIEPRGSLKIEARAADCAPRTVTVPAPPPARTVLVALERVPLLRIDLREPLTAAAFAGSDLAVVVARNGRVFGVGARDGAVVWRFLPDGIETQRRAPLVAGGAAWCVAEDGRGRIFDARDGRVRGATVTGPRCVARAVGDGFAFADGRRIALLSLDGVVAPRGELPEGAVAEDLAVGADGALWVAAGAAGLFLCERGAAPRRVDDGPATFVAVAESGATLFVRPGVGVFSRDAAGATGLVVDDADARGVWAVGGGRFVARLGSRGVALLEGEKLSRRTQLPQDATEAPPTIDVDGRRAAFALASGWTAVLDTTDLRTTAGRACDLGARPALRDGMLLDPRESGRLDVVPER